MLDSSVSLRAFRAAAAVAIAASISLVCAQTRDAAAFPERVVRIFVQAGPGGPPDLRARLIASKLADRWGKPVIVDNRPGAGGQLALDQVAHSAPDGYSLVLAGQGLLVIAPHLRKLPYDPLKELTPITPVGISPVILVVNAALPVRNVAELIAHAKRNPGKLNAASAGIATTNHLAIILFSRAAGVAMTHVPYKDGVGQTLVDLNAGQTDLIFDVFTSLGPHLKSGRLRALAVSGPHRMAVLPDVPTFAEAGFPELGPVFIWSGFFARAGTPRAIVDRLNGTIRDTLRLADVQASFIANGTTPTSSTPEEFSALIRTEYERYGKLIREPGIKLE